MSNLDFLGNIDASKGIPEREVNSGSFYIINVPGTIMLEHGKEKFKKNDWLYFENNVWSRIRMDIKQVVCVETGEVFKSIKDAAESLNVKEKVIKFVLDRFELSINGKHYCTDIGVFNNEIKNCEERLRMLNGILSLKNARGKNGKNIYCFETSEKYDTIRDAAIAHSINVSTFHNYINNTNDNRTGFHWCTNLEEFKVQMELKKKPVYCYETGEKFNDVDTAARRYDIKANIIINSIDKVNCIGGNYHWCTDLEKFREKMESR